MSADISSIPAARVALAGVSHMCEAIFRSALERRPDIELVLPWTRLPSLKGYNGSDVLEILVVELERAELPRAMRTLLCIAPSLRIIGISDKGRTATVFRMLTQKKTLRDRSAVDLCALLDSVR